MGYTLHVDVGRETETIDDCQRAISCLYMVVRHLSTVLAVLSL